MPLFILYSYSQNTYVNCIVLCMFGCKQAVSQTKITLKLYMSGGQLVALQKLSNSSFYLMESTYLMMKDDGS